MSYLCCDDSEVKWYTKIRDLSDEITCQMFMNFYIVSLNLVIRRINILVTQSVNNYLHFAKVL